MKSLDEISIDEILHEINLNLINNDFEVILNRDKDAIKELNDLLMQNKQKVKGYVSSNSEKTIGTQRLIQNEKTSAAILSELNRDAVVTILRKYEHVVSKENLILINTYNSEYRLETEGKTLSPELRAAIKKDVEKGLRLLAKKNCTIAIPIYDEASQLFTKLKVINSEELARSIKNGTKINATNTMSKKKFERLKEIDDRAPLSNLVQAISDEDLMYIVATDPEIGKGMIYQTAWNSMIRYFDAHSDKKINIFDYTVSDEMQRKTRKSQEGIATTEETLIKNCKYIDIDNLLLIAAYRFIEMLENDKDNSLHVEMLEGKSKEGEHKEESVKILQRILESIKREIAKGTKIDVLYEEDGTRIQYSVEELESDLRRFRDGKFLTKAEIQETREKLLSNELKLSEIDEYEIKFLNLTEKDIRDLFVASEENIIFVIDLTSASSEAVYGTLCDF